MTVNEQAIKDAAKSASSFKVKANTHAEEEVKGGDTITFNNGDNIEISQTGKTFTIKTAKNITVDSVTAGNTVINTSGLTNGTTAITGTGITTDKVTVGGISIDKTAGINAGSKVISNVASGTVNNNATDDSNAANIGDVKQAVANLSQNLNITDGTNNGTVDLKNQKLNVAGANGVTTTVNNQTITVGLDANTVNATTKGIGLTADTGSTGNKYLKDGDVSFAVTGDGNLVSTSATAAGVKVAVDAAKVKDLAVSAVTVSKDAQADNPITVTPTAGANSKDYAIGIDTTKLAALWTWKEDGYFLTYFHPWEFTSLSDRKELKLPFIMTNHSGCGMERRLDALIRFFKDKRAPFGTYTQFSQEILSKSHDQE